MNPGLYLGVKYKRPRTGISQKNFCTEGDNGKNLFTQQLLMSGFFKLHKGDMEMGGSFFVLGCQVPEFPRSNNGTLRYYVVSLVSKWEGSLPSREDLATDGEA